jgi:multimeric flavodoxin WrbA
MKTLIFNGSPKVNGDTEALIKELASHLKGEVKILSFQNNINPCNDCRFCWENAGCTINDEMQDIYPFIEECDNIVFASPIWFMSLSGPLLNMASRIQTIWAAGYFRKEVMPIKEKNGVIILVGAQPETKDIPTQTALIIMRYLNVHRPSVEKIYSLDTNVLPASKDEAALARCREVADMLNNKCE